MGIRGLDADEGIRRLSAYVGQRSVSSFLLLSLHRWRLFVFATTVGAAFLRYFYCQDSGRGVGGLGVMSKDLRRRR